MKISTHKTTTNPWYALMTLFGEQDHLNVNYELNEQNYPAWNAWACQHLTDEERQDLRNLFNHVVVPEADAWPLMKNKIRELFAKRMGAKIDSPKIRLPDPQEKVDMTDFKSDRVLVLHMMIFTQQVTFRNAQFGSKTDFLGTLFSEGVTFEASIFQDNANLASVIGSGSAIFRAAIFEGHVDFSNALLDNLDLSDARFERSVDFEGANFKKAANFGNTNFSGRLGFRRATFSTEANFQRSSFENDVDFHKTKFKRGAIFDASEFKGFTSFQSAEFGSDLLLDNAEVSFANSIFRKSTRFNDAKFFSCYPDLSGTDLPINTQFMGENGSWSNTVENAATARASCAIIRHVFARQGAIEEEQFFHRREMYFAARSGSYMKRLPYQIYERTDFGTSIAKPSYALLALWLIPGLIYMCYFNWSIEFYETNYAILSSFGFSFSNIFKFFGFQRVYFEPDFIYNLHWLIKCLSAGQTVMGFVFLFFLGLGLRSRFRLR